MKPLRSTQSLCPVCYKRIPAVIGHDVDTDSIIMKKTCSDHGDFLATVESSPQYYHECMMAAAPTIYGGHFIDVTEKCNLKCKYCYFPVNNKAEDRSVASIVQEVVINHGAERIILTGGEPTLRDDLVYIINVIQAVKPVELLTNGTLLTDEKLDELCPILSEGGIARINLSLHGDLYADCQPILDRFRQKKIKIESVLYVIDDIEQVYEFVEFCRQWKDVICATRIKAATPIWNEQKPDERIFVSDIIDTLKSMGASMIWWRNNKVSFANLGLDGIMHMAVSWYDVRNIDLLDIRCAPTYTAKTGQVENIVTSFIINEGLQKGWLSGVRLWE